ncbi:MAG: type III-A CRISPR-associated RAMP protein Csm5 [Desulfobacterales bacterium]|nr:type III-A CRISPR-associated RAMP protein Csm5 [Desulfobacterales bacterium]
MKLRIETVSPIHIGSGRDISPMEYWLRDVFVRIDLESLFRDDAFAGHVESFINGAGSERYIGQYAPESLLEKHHVYWAPLAPDAGAHLGSNPIAVKEFVKTAGRVFLPGSAIKGSILSSLIFHALSELYPKVKNRPPIDAALHQPDNRFAYHKLLDMVFTHFKLPGPLGRNNRFFSWLSVSDAGLAAPDQALRVSMTSVKGSGTGDSPPVICETLDPNVALRLTMDPGARLRWDMTELLEIADHYYRLVWAKATPTRRAPSEGWLLHIGQGGSAYATSLLIFADMNDVDSKIYTLPPPRTRKEVEGDAPLGWVIITPAEEDEESVGEAPLSVTFAPLPPREEPEIPEAPAAVEPPAAPAAAPSAASSTAPSNASPSNGPVTLKRDRELKGLMRQVDLAPPNDLFGLNRLTEALDDVEDEDVQREVAAALRDKLKKAGVWKQHRLRPEIEFYLIGD